MASHKSALKRDRQSKKRRERNRARSSRVKSFVKKALGAIEEGAPKEQLDLALRGAEKEIRKAASKGVVPRRRADRKVSRLAKARNRAGKAAQAAAAAPS